jgi:type IV secretion system protein TrbG
MSNVALKRSVFLGLLMAGTALSGAACADAGVLQPPSAVQASKAGAVAATAGTATSADSAASVLSHDKVTLTAGAQRGLGLSKAWQQGSSSGALPVVGHDGMVVFPFADGEAHVVCAPLQICDIALQADENATKINLGDTARWVVSTATSGSGGAAVEHVIVKPTDVGLRTSMVITTDMRTYHIALESTEQDYMASVGFSYPSSSLAEVNAALATQKASVDLHHQQALATATAQREAAAARAGARRAEAEAQVQADQQRKDRIASATSNLDFNYRLTGDAAWKPVRVYNNGQKTYIDMPASLSTSDAPALLVIARPGSVFTKAQTRMVNYRLIGHSYVVDAVFDRAILVAGTGALAQRITIERLR